MGVRIKKYLYVALQRCNTVRLLHAFWCFSIARACASVSALRENDRASGYNILPCVPM